MATSIVNAKQGISNKCFTIVLLFSTIDIN